MLFDTHAHYDDARFNEDRNAVIEKAFNSGVSYILNASSDVSSCVESVSLTQEHENIYAAVGIHPHHAAEMNENILDMLLGLASRPKIVAIGEIGLDYFYDNSPRDIQKYWFARQIGLAAYVKLPIIVHDRDAHEDILEIIKHENARRVGGVFHCYTGSVEMARELLNHGFYLSFGGPVTFKNAKRAIEAVKYVPEDRILIETDSPYLTPEPFRGKRNDSGYVRLVAEKIAAIRNTTFEEISRITTENAKRLFNI